MAGALCCYPHPVFRSRINTQALDAVVRRHLPLATGHFAGRPAAACVPYPASPAEVRGYGL